MNAPLGIPGQGPSQRFGARERMGFLPRGWIDGLGTANDSTDATNDIVIQPGAARSTCCIVDGAASTFDHHQMDLTLPVQIIKQLDGSFAPENYDPDGYGSGARSGGRSSSSLANGTWHPILVGGGGLQPDVIFHDSLTQSSILAEMQKAGGYTAYRHFMSNMRVGGLIRLFTQAGDEVRWTAPTTDIDTTISGTAANHIVAVPLGVSVLATVAISITHSSTNTGAVMVHPSDTATDPSASANGLAVVHCMANTVNVVLATCYTDTSGQVRVRSTNSSTTCRLSAYRYVHPRGRNA